MEVAETAALIDRALRRVRVRFREPPDTAVLAHARGEGPGAGRPGWRAAAGERGDGRPDQGARRLSVTDFETERPSLEEVFLAFYEGDRAGET